ncbi:glycosyltransferase [Fontimonas sp. SYSU GA230001]|uniref:glycosyltransferase n=1 Tax=Fontimonas sp. SYSU GA230001 TaxID=3142450 RepID=UPI0032B363E6
MNGTPVRWTISVVSHGHGERVAAGLADIHGQLEGVEHRFVLTLNAREDPGFVDRLPPAIRARLHLIRNARPRGFAANHNAALRGCRSRYVLVADPDLRLSDTVFPDLERALGNPACGIVAPLAQTSLGDDEDNGRDLPTLPALLRRRLFGRDRDIPRDPPPQREVVWLAGLFLALRAETFQRLGGFDERYHMYCEDVDLCLRARALGLTVDQLCSLRIVHDARRGSLRSPRHFLWHSQSLLRLWRSPAYRAARGTRGALR